MLSASIFRFSCQIPLSLFITMNFTTRKFICSLLFFWPLAITYAKTFPGHLPYFRNQSITYEELAALSFPPEVSTVKLFNTRITKIDAAQFQHVKMLSIYDNPIEELIGVFENLQRLNMTKTSIKNLDGRNFPNLQYLVSLEGKLETLTGEWKELEFINLSKNKLSQINATMPKITQAYFTANKLKNFDCVYGELQNLNLSENNLTDGTLHVSGCRKLERLYIGYNNIDVLGDEVADKLPFLHVLEAQMCGLKEWYGNWPNLDRAMLNDNSLSKVNASIPKIIDLNVNNNKLDKFFPRPFFDRVTDFSFANILGEMFREGVMVNFKGNTLRYKSQREKQNAADSTPKPIKRATKKPERTFLSQKRAPFK